MEELFRIINIISIEFEKQTLLWKQSSEYQHVNYSTTNVRDINNEIKNQIVKYRSFISDATVDLFLSLGEKFQTCKVNTRIKNANSIEYKIENYNLYHVNGKVSINKCLNDICGIRVILFHPMTLDEIMKTINDKYSNLKCRNSSKGEYKAVHLYFKNGNDCFQWELQIWNAEDESKNLESHKKYKQEYAQWEKENRGVG